MMGSLLPTHKTLAQERLKQVAFYVAETGEFYRVFASGEKRLICRPGPAGYYRMRIDGNLYQVHRLAWLYVHGVFPPAIMDHVNGIRSDNRIVNLRPCSYLENVQNVSAKARGKSGFKGVFRSTHGNRFEARIGLNYKTIRLGYFKTPEAAHAAYLEAKKKHHTFAPVPRSGE